MNLKDLLIPRSANIKDALKNLDKTGSQIALIVDSDKLIGIASDGDIRRALLNGETLESDISKAMVRDYHYSENSMTQEDALRRMRQLGIHHIPVIDKNRRILTLYSFDDIIHSTHRPNSVVIMAGGRGSRLGNLTSSCPKPMLTVSGKPMLEVVLQQCIDSGFHKFYISVNYLKQKIIDYFGDGKNWGVDIEYLEESEPLGTAGSLSLITDIQEHPIIVMNCDVLSHVNYNKLLRFHEQGCGAGTMCIREHSIRIPYGTIVTEGGIVKRIEEKPVLRKFINAGIYVINPELLSLVSKNRYLDMTNFLDDMLKIGIRLTAYPLHEFWMDLGHPEDLATIQELWNTSNN